MPLSPVELRHKLHQKPELMFNEFETTKLLEENLSKLNGLKIHKPLETGLVAEYKVNDGPYLLFRADIDALPIKEETGSEFASVNDCMHACGHDVHTSILYGFTEYVTKSKIDKNILFLFQPGEEAGGGAEKVINSGILDNFNITNAFALHVTDEYDKGTIASTSGVLFASAFEIDIDILGKSAHVAFPENGIHSFDALRLFLDEADKALKEQKERVIFGYGKIISGTARNIIPAYSRAECTIRTLSKNRSRQFYDRLLEILDDVKKRTGADYKVTEGTLYSEVIVNDELFKRLSKVLSQKHKFIDCGYKMTGEDFGFFSTLYPSMMFWLGTSEGEHYGLHTPKFLPSDGIIEIGINIFKDILQEVK
ncbi:MAG: M20 family metallopeptidase [Bacteroidota bacterium]|nr:M20 family metallopeptidase [Bacteroidota bacterium]